MEFSKRQLRFFERAANVAKGSDFDRYHLGCIAVLKNHIVAASANKLKTHPQQARFDRFREFNNIKSDPRNMHSLHAEIACLNMLRDQDIPYKDLELYIVRLRRDLDYGLARPCAACFNYIKSLGVRKIYYTSNGGFVYEEIF